ncbi:TonB-dependent receptor [Flavobacteriaceae bacterium D16]|nr:TonB-dependent receptor [Flavobacteriaceae bacterium D16]
MKFKIACLIMLLPSAIIFAQECRYVFKGQVVDFHDKSPLAEASIFINQIGRSAVTDAQGNFEFEEMCPGTYQIQAAHSGCQTLFLEVEISGDTYTEILLEHHRVELEEVRVFGAPLADKTISAIEQSLEEETLEQFSGASLGDALKTISGVSSLNTGANIVKPAIHGLNGSRVLILNDGVRMQDMEWGDEHAPNVDLNAANSVTVIKGASALKYGGDAIGGVILLEQKNLAVKDTLFGKTLLTGLTNGRGGTITSELNKSFHSGLYLKGQASFKRLGDAEAPDYILSNTGISEVGASFQLGRKQLAWGWDVRYAFYNAEIAILRSSHIGNIDDLIRSINSGEPEIIRDFTYDLQNPRQEVTHHLAKAKIYRRFEGLGRLNVQYDFQNNRRFEYDVRRGERDDTPSIDLELQTHTLTTDFKLDANERYELQFGLLGRYQDNFANPATGVRRLIPDYQKYDLGSFITGEYFLSELWTLEAGLRYDFNRIDAQKFYRVSRWEERGYDQDFADIIVEDLGTQYLTNPVFNYHNISVSAGVAYKDEDQNFRFNYALSQRAPNPSELFSDGLHHSAARIELGDLRIDQETSHKFSFSFEKDFDYWGFTIEPYANFIQDFVLLEPTGVEFTLRGAFPVWSFRQTDARLLGVDVSAYVDYTQNWRSDHRFSLVKGNDTDTDIPLINIPAANIVNQISYTQLDWHNFEISLESQYVFRQNETPDDIIVFSPDQQQNVLLEINTAPEAYHLLNLNSSMSFPLGGRTQLTTSLSVNNLLDTSFRDYLNRQRFFADDLGRNIILQLKLNY